MAQGEFTKQEANRCVEALGEMFNGLTKSKKMEFLGHLNDISLFLGAAKEQAPNETPKKKEDKS